MWNVSNDSLQMAEGDFGVQLPIIVSGTTLSASDTIKVTIKKNRNAVATVEKTYTNIADNTIPFELTEAESARLPVGAYVYAIDWYQNGSFLCNLIPCGVFKVVDKA